MSDPKTQKAKNPDCQKLLNTSTNYYAQEIKRLNKESETEKLLEKWGHLLYEGVDYNKKKLEPLQSTNSSKSISNTLKPSNSHLFIQQQQQQPKSLKSKSKTDLAIKYETMTASMKQSINDNLKSASSTNTTRNKNRSQIDRVLNLVLDRPKNESSSLSTQPKQTIVSTTSKATPNQVRNMIKPQSVDSKLSSMAYLTIKPEEKLLPKLNELPSYSKTLLAETKTKNSSLKSNHTAPNNLNSLPKSNKPIEIPRIRNFQTPIKHSTSIDTTAFTNINTNTNTRVTFTLNPDSIINFDNINNNSSTSNSTLNETLKGSNETKSITKKSSFPISLKSNTLLTKSYQNSPNLTRETNKLSEFEKSLLNAIATDNSIAASNEDNTATISSSSSSGSSSNRWNPNTTILNNDELDKTINRSLNKKKSSSKKLDPLENDELVEPVNEENITNNFEVEIEADEEDSEEKESQENKKRSVREKFSTPNGKKSLKKKLDRNKNKEASIEELRPNTPPPKPKIFNITGDEDWNSDVLKSAKPVIVEFHSAYCGPCRMLEPKLEKLVESYNGQIDLAKVDINYSYIASEYDVSSVPQLFAVRNGKIIDRYYGLGTEEKLKEFVKSAIEV